ncbi:MAG: MarR family winged helix-turn-helix transcriptional regulator [Clostridiales Family XIII bacterium]|jgi:DNA-binding MarR family transcriptional regulator|nr:MarR family winged helix-turn-helix transcriptional regulator [Clostridiales Family XIII bacterium]
MDYERATRELIAKCFSVARSKEASDFRRFSKGEMHLLNHLCEHPERAMPGCLSEQMGISSARIAMILNSLEAKGLIERSIDRADRRKILVTVTDDGAQLIREKRIMMQKAFGHVLQEMGESDTREFIRLVTRFLDIMQQMHGAPPHMDGDEDRRRPCGSAADREDCPHAAMCKGFADKGKDETDSEE